MKGYSALELLVALFLSAIVIISYLVFFESQSLMSVHLQKYLFDYITLIRVSNILYWDFLKAGYGVNGTAPFEVENDKVSLKYVDYDLESCEDKSFSVGNSCSYRIEYLFSDGKLLRRVDKRADGSFASASIIDGIEDFSAEKVSESLVSFSITKRNGEKEITIKRYVEIPNR